MHVPQTARAVISPLPSVGFDATDYSSFAHTVEARFGIQLNDYRSDQMLRRLRSLAESKGHPSFASLMLEMQKNAAMLEAFLDTMTINVTELLRNPERFTELHKTLLPNLLAQPRIGPFKAWSAGCSYGAEAVTLAFLLHEAEPAGQHRIKATDIDLSVLAKANSICFSEQDMAHVSSERRMAHFADIGLPGMGPLAPRYRPQLSLRNKIQFGRHDLLADPYPTAEYDLVVCRNVLIYFTEPAKTRIFRGFFQALRPGGILFVGGTERVPDHRALGFDLVRPFFYSKPA